LITYSGFIIGQFLFRFLYYGHFLPNTYTLKVKGMPFFIRLSNGLGFITPLLIILLPLIILVLLDLLGDFFDQKVYLVLIFFVAILYQIFVGGDAFSYWRMIAPVMPVFLILFTHAVFAGIQSFQKTPFFEYFFGRNSLISRKSLIQLFTFLLIISAGYILNKPYLREALLLEDSSTFVLNYYNVNRALILNDVTTDQATIGVTWAGSIPYYTGKKAIDFLGKSDPVIASLPPDLSGAVSWSGMLSAPGHNKYDLDYSIKKLQPTYVQSFVWGSDNLKYWRDQYYIEIKYQGIDLYLKDGSPHILWDKIQDKYQ
jgi:hypothetical protein